MKRIIFRISIITIIIFSITYITNALEKPRCIAHSNLIRILKYDSLLTENKNYTLKLAKNEYEGFHITVQSGGSKLDSIQFQISDLIRSDSLIIDKSNIAIYREHYLNIDTLSYLSTAPKGYYPDALIPFINPTNNSPITSAKYLANNYSIAQSAVNINQSYYIEIYSPPDTKAGDYYATVTITANNEILFEVAVTVHIWDFVLPDRTPFKSCFGLNGTTYKNYFGGAGTERFKKANSYFETEMLKHRIMPDYPLKASDFFSTNGVNDSAGFCQFLRYYFDTLNANSFKLPLYTNWPPNDINSDDTLKMIKYIQSYYNCFTSIGHEDDFYTYIVDEPSKRDFIKVNIKSGNAHIKITENVFEVYYNSGVPILSWSLQNPAYNTLDKIRDSLIANGNFTVSDKLYSFPDGTHSYKCIIKRDSIDISTNTSASIVSFNEYELVRQFASIVHTANPAIKFLCTESPEVDSPAWGNLYGYVNIWCPLFSYWNYDLLIERANAGDEIWGYTALCQPGRIGLSPYWETDYPLLNYRITSWISFVRNTVGVLYWESTYWGDAINPWDKAITYRNSPTIVYNGEGSLFYPGVEAGYDGPVTSLRLKAIRDGIEDYTYFKIADSLGLNSFTQEQIILIANYWNDWRNNPDSLELIRDTIAFEIENAIKTKSVEILSSDYDNVSISPNPAESFVYIKTNSPVTDIKSITIYNSIGEKIRNIHVDKTLKFDIGDLTSGLYFVIIRINNQDKVLKLIKI